MTVKKFNADKIQMRDMKIRAVNSDKREVTGIAVPYNTVIDVDGWFREQVAPGAIQNSDVILFFWRHDEPIGRVISTRETPEGFEITAIISETPRGDEAYTLLKDGVVDRLSIGFNVVEYSSSIDPDTQEELITYTNIQVLEVSAVPFPAYDAAKVSQVREASTQLKEGSNKMPDSHVEISELRGSVEELERSVSLLSSNINTSSSSEHVDNFRSFGEMVKLVASGDADAKRAYEGMVLSDSIVKDSWIGDLIKVIRDKQVVASSFQRGTLPATGMSVEYGVLNSNTVAVGVQAAEGDPLPFGKVDFTTDTAPVKTLGGWSSVSRQVIERSNINVLTTLFEALANAYGRAVELEARNTFLTRYALTTSIDANLGTQDGIVAAIVNSAEYFDANGLALSGIKVSAETFLALLAVPSTDRVLQISNAGPDKIGTANISSISGDIANVKVQVIPGLTGQVFAPYDDTAILTLESAGAPVQLQDDNIVNLTRDFSVYGYESSVLQNRLGILRVNNVV